LDESKIAVLAEDILVLFDDRLEGGKITDADGSRKIKVRFEGFDHSFLLKDGLFRDLSDQKLHDAEKFLRLIDVESVTKRFSLRERERDRKQKTNGDSESKSGGLRSLSDGLSEVSISL